MYRVFFFLFLGLIANAATISHAQDLEFLAEEIFGEQDFLPVREAFQPSISFDDSDLVVNWYVEPEYYLYQERLEVKANGQNFDAPIFEAGVTRNDEYYGRLVEVYYEPTSFRVPNFEYSGDLELVSQGCAEAGLCYAPTSYWFSIDSNNQQATAIDAPAQPSGSSGSTAATSGTSAGSIGPEVGFFAAILMAFAGGIILNLMPCVFPVLAIKALKVSSGGDSAIVRLKDSAAYTAGIVLTTLSIAGAMLILRAGGAQIGWGFQLQSPVVVTLLMYLFFVVGLSFSGWILFGARFAGAGQNLVAEGKPFQSFFTGVLAMVVASPCSAPFMAISLGYAVSQPAWVALLIFAFLGIGMAFPLVLINSVPALSRRLPKPGAWMETLKEVLAFPMYLTSAWLLWVLIAQVGATGAALAVAGLCTLAAMFWGMKQQGSRAATAFSLAMLISTGAFLWQGITAEKPVLPGSNSDNQFVLSKLDSMVGGENPVFLDVTADWCITCKFNETRVLYTNEVQEMFTEKNVIYLVADWTNDNPDISALLERYNRVGIPLYLYFPAGSSEAQVLPQILTKDIMKTFLASR